LSDKNDCDEFLIIPSFEATLIDCGFAIIEDKPSFWINLLSFSDCDNSCSLFYIGKISNDWILELFFMKII